MTTTEIMLLLLMVFGFGLYVWKSLTSVSRHKYDADIYYVEKDNEMLLGRIERITSKENK